MVRLALVVAVGGCAFHPGRLATGADATSDAATVRDASDAPPAPWGTPTPVNVMPNADDPSLTDDLLELYFNANGDIYVVTRTSVVAPWGTPAVIAAVSTASETTPEVSYDGLTLLFASDRAGTLGSQDIWIATRTTRQSAWGSIAAVAGLNTSSQEASSVMTPDQLAIVFTSGKNGSSDIYTSLRANPSQAWPAPVEQTALNTGGHEGSCFLTADGLTVYFDSDRTGNNDLYLARRATRNDAFDAPGPLADIDTAGDEEDAWLSSDGHHLFFYSDRDGMPGLWESAR